MGFSPMVFVFYGEFMFLVLFHPNIAPQLDLKLIWQPSFFAHFDQKLWTFNHHVFFKFQAHFEGKICLRINWFSGCISYIAWHFYVFWWYFSPILPPNWINYLKPFIRPISTKNRGLNVISYCLQLALNLPVLNLHILNKNVIIGG